MTLDRTCVSITSTCKKRLLTLILRFTQASQRFLRALRPS
jgi:hypothetical protein